MNRGHSAPSSIITKSPGFGIRALTEAEPYPNHIPKGYGLHSSLAVHIAMNRSTTESIG